MCVCEYVRDSRPWGAHSRGPRAGARHCDINIPSLSAVNQRGIRRSSLTLLADLCPEFRVTRREIPEIARKETSLLLPRSLLHPTALVFTYTSKESNRTKDGGNFRTVDEEVYVTRREARIICGLIVSSLIRGRIGKNCFRILKQSLSTKN